MCEVCSREGEATDGAFEEGNDAPDLPIDVPPRELAGSEVEEQLVHIPLGHGHVLGHHVAVEIDEDLSLWAHKLPSVAPRKELPCMHPRHARGATYGLSARCG